MKHLLKKLCHAEKWLPWQPDKKLQGPFVFSNKKLFKSFLEEICALKLKINCVFSKTLFLITTDRRIRKKQLDKKAVFLPCRFGTSSPQAIGVTCKLP